jgi:tripartite-type tricarboxylate transporter receptor subunit TctC
MMRKLVLCLLIVLFILSFFIPPKEILAAQYYEGKRITIIVGYAPGGGYDRTARLLAKYLPKYIPGKPSIIVENMPGADSMIAANHLYNIAKPDGLTIGTFNRGLAFAQLLKAEGAKFDTTKYSWIGSAGVEATVLALRTDLPYKSFEDLKKAKETIVVGATGPGDPVTYGFPALLKELLGLNLKIVTGYTSSADIMLAVERKEVDGRGASYGSIKPLIERGLVRPFIRGRASEQGIENLPVDEDLVQDDKRKKIMGMRSAPERIARPYVAPPGTPSDVMNILKDAFTKVVKDPELKEDAKKVRMEVEYIPVDECLKIINFILTQPEDIVKEFNKYVKF